MSKMKKMIFVLMFLLSASVVLATSVSLSVTWQLSSNVTRLGAYTTIYLTIANTGVDVTGITIAPTAGPGLHIVSGSNTEIGDLPATYSQQSSISVKADDNASSTTSYVYLDITYYYSSSQYEKELYIPITIRGDPILQIENVNFSSSLQPGKMVTVSFDLVNEGLGTAKDITVSVAQDSNFVTSGSSGEFFISTLGKSQSQHIVFNLAVSPDASIGTVTIPIILSYSDDTRSTSYNKTQEIGVQITGNYNFIATVDSQDVIASGTSGYVTIKLANGGNQEAFHLLINVLNSDNFSASPTTIYVGNLNSDDYDSEKILVDVGSVELGYYPLNINVSYEDSFGNSYNALYPVSVLVSTKAEYTLANPPQTPIGLFVIAIIIIVVVFIAYRKGYFHKILRRK